MTTKVFFATTNPGKVTSVQRVLSRYGIEVVRLDIELPELQGETAADVIKGKIRAAYDCVQAPVMAIDSAFHMNALNGFPGTNVKPVSSQIGLQGYLDLLGGWGVAEGYGFRRDCRFEDAAAYMDSIVSGPQVFVRKEYGLLARAPRGDASGHKSPLAALFIPQGCDKTLAEMTPEELLAYRSRPETEHVYHELARHILDTPVAGI